MFWKKKSELEKIVEGLQKQISDIVVENQAQIDNLISDKQKLMQYIAMYEKNVGVFVDIRERAKKEIDDLKNIYNIEIQRETDILITKALEHLDKWFNTIVSDRSNDLSDRCQSCRTISFASTLENVGVAMKEEFRIAFDKNGFLKAEGAEFDTYVKNLHSTFRKLIRTSLIHFYIFPSSLDKYFTQVPPNQEFEQAMVKVYDVIYELISTVRTKERKLFVRIEEIRVEMDKDLKDLLPSRDGI
jgi:hypothetical protein